MTRCDRTTKQVWTLATTVILVTGCATSPPPRPPSHFELAKKAVEQKDFRRAGQEFEEFANQELAKLKSGGDLKWIRNTVLAYRDAANNYHLAGDTEAALKALETCIAQMAPFADGKMCEARGLTFIKEPAVTPSRASQFLNIASEFDTVREERRAVVQADVEARQRRAEQAQREWEAGAPQRQWQQERDRIERDLGLAQASEQMLVAAHKDAGMARLQRQMLESQLADHDRNKPPPVPVPVQTTRTPALAPSSTPPVGSHNKAVVADAPRPAANIQAGSAPGKEVSQTPGCIDFSIDEYRKLNIRNKCPYAVQAIACVNVPGVPDPRFTCSSPRDPIMGGVRPDGTFNTIQAPPNQLAGWFGPLPEGSKLQSHSIVACPVSVDGKRIDVKSINFNGGAFMGKCVVYEPKPVKPPRGEKVTGGETF